MHYRLQPCSSGGCNRVAAEATTPRLREVALVARLSPLVVEPAHVLDAVGDQKESSKDVTLARRHLVAAASSKW